VIFWIFKVLTRDKKKRREKKWTKKNWFILMIWWFLFHKKTVDFSHVFFFLAINLWYNNRIWLFFFRATLFRAHLKIKMREFDDCVQKTKKLEVERTKKNSWKFKREGKKKNFNFFFKIETYFYTWFFFVAIIFCIWMNSSYSH